jgi:hypothetical protein
MKNIVPKHAVIRVTGKTTSKNTQRIRIQNEIKHMYKKSNSYIKDLYLTVTFLIHVLNFVLNSNPLCVFNCLCFSCYPYYYIFLNYVFRKKGFVGEGKLRIVTREGWSRKPWWRQLPKSDNPDIRSSRLERLRVALHHLTYLAVAWCPTLRKLIILRIFTTCSRMEKMARCIVKTEQANA